MIVLRTFSKAFGLAGARIGYALASRELAAELNARQAPAPVSSLVGGARASPRSPRRPTSRRCSRSASGSPRRCARSGSRRSRRRRTSSSARSTTRRALGDGAAAPGARRARLRRRDPDHDPRPRRRRPDRRGARARCSSGPRRSAASRRARASATCARPPRRASRCGSGSTARAGSASRPAAGIYDHFLEQLAFHAGLRPRRRGRGRPRDRRPPHRRGHGARASARRSTARSATAAGSRATATPTCRWTTRSRAPRSTSAAGPTPSSRSTPTPASPATSSEPRPGRRGWRSTSRPRAATPTTSPRPPTRPAAGRCARRVRVEGDGTALDQGAAVKVAVCDYRPGNIRSVEIAMRRLGAELVDDVAGCDLAILPGRRLGALGDGRARAARGSTRCCASASPQGRAVLGICLGPPARARLDRGGRRRRRARHPARAARCASATGACRAWAGPRSTATAYYFAHSYTAETPCATSWSEGIVAEARSGLVPRRAVPPREERRRRRALPRPRARRR